MAFFFESTKKMANHVATWSKNGPLKERLDRAFQRDRAMIEDVQAETLKIGYDGQPSYTARSRGPVFRSNDVTLEFIEEWTYPSSDLLRWLDRAYPYDTREPPPWIRDPSNGTTPANMLNWAGRLLMVARSDGQTLHVAMHYNTLPWNKPRAMQKFLGDYAQHLRKSGEPAPGRRQVERDFLQELKAPDPAIGGRVWHTFVESDIEPENLHAQLIIFCWQQNFPVPADDEALVIKFIGRLVRQTARNSSREDIEEFVAECLSQLVTHFDIPSSSSSLPAYITKVVQAIIASKRRQHIYESFQLSSGPTYSVSQTRMRIRAETVGSFEPEFRDVLWTPSETTIYDWLKAGKIESERTDDGSIVITEQGLQTAIALARQRNARRCALARGEARGLSRERTEQIIHRHRKPDGTPDWQLIDEKIEAASPDRTRAGKRRARR